ncbi:MAG TPA: EAL domain-containing protein [Gammaproteobacteria bacterium]|nr:EAL domain-containing protein [Gammaproteobacteria bacterium]
MLEDNARDVELILGQLKRDGLRIAERVVSDERNFQAALADFVPQVILSDFSLPRFDGLSALKIARANAPAVPFIFVSGTIGEERAIEALQGGASDYVLKDNLRRLVPAIRNAIRQREVARSRDLAEELLRRSESRLQAIIDTSADWIWECNAERQFTFSSPSIGAIIGHTRHSVLGRSSLDYVDARDRERLTEAFDSVSADESEAPPLTLRWAHKDGTARWLERKMVALHSDDGTLHGFRGIDRDVTPRVLQEARIGRLNRALQFLSGANSAIVRIRNRRELLKETCRLAVQIGGYTMATVYLRSSEDRKDPLVLRAVSAEQAAAKRPPSEPMDGDGPVGRAMQSADAIIVADFNAPDTRVPGQDSLVQMGVRSCIAMPFLIDGTPIGAVLLHANEPNAFIGAELDLLHRFTANIAFALQYLHDRESIEYLAYFDTLTALANRSLYVQRLDQMIAASKRDDTDLVLLVFDIAGLNVINDGLGHHTGDLVLQLVAERMKNIFRDSKCLCYLGGGRYAVASTHGHDSLVATTVLRERVDFLFDSPFVVDSQELRLSIRAGFAQFPEDGTTADALLHHAQTALDRAKQDGARYLRHDPAMNAAASERLSLTNSLRTALEKQEFDVHYQPKTVLATGAVDGVEALLRWPARAVSPSVFVPILEAIGLIDDVSMWLMERALLETSQWARGGQQAVRVAVNVSPLQLRREEFADDVLAALARTGADPNRLELEVTESALMTDPSRAAAILGHLRERGVTVAIDDFGTGYSSLQVLTRLPVDVLKIDRSFIQDLATNERHRLVVQTTITLAQSFGLKTVAEGVETEVHADILRGLGCDVLQGYLVHRPAPAGVIGRWLGLQGRHVAPAPGGEALTERPNARSRA